MTYRLGDFELLEPLGQGGMATVWLARHSVMGFEAAVKLVTSELSNDKFMRAFEFEARNHAALVHPAIAALHDFGHVTERDAPPEDLAPGTPFLVMARARATLRDVLSELDWPKARQVLNDILDGLAFAHAHRVIHRDLKPENVLVFDDGVRHRLTDFGIAQPLALEKVTFDDLTNQTAGTPHYMPPEQLRGQTWSFGPWTDLYALGCLTYELVCGHCPFTGTSIMQIARQHLGKEVPPLTPRFAVPEGLEGWIRRLLVKDPFSRFTRSADARHALSQLEDPVDVETPKHSVSDPTTADTIVDDFATDETLEATGEVVTEIVTGSTKTVGAAERTVAPLEKDWRRPDAYHEKLHQYLGPGLFAMRQPGQMGFERIRDVLWRELDRVATRRKTSVLVLSGESGAPTKGLAEWLSIRSHELGAATDLRTFYSPTGGPYDGLPGLIAHGFHLVATDPDDMADAIARQLDADDKVVRAQCDMLANEVRRARNAATHGPTARSAAQLFEAFSLLLERLAVDRPIVIWLEDVHYSQDGLAIVDHLLGRELPVLVVLTTVPRASANQSSASRALEMLARNPEVLSIDIAPYDDSVQARLLDALISLEDATRDRIVEATRPDVVFMRALVAKLIDDGQLRFEEDSFRLPDDAVFPANPDALYRARLAEIARDFGIEGTLALCAAAALGASPTHDDWHAVLDLLDADLQPDLISALTRKGLASAGERGISFVDRRAHEAVIQTSRDEGYWARLNLACADHLSNLEHRDGPLLRRLAGHQWEAGKVEAALETMTDSISKLVPTEPARAEPLLEIRQRWLEQSNLPKTSPLAIDQAYLNATCALSMGRGDDAARRLEHVKEVSAGVGYELGLARAEMHLGHVTLKRGEFEQAKKHLDSALATFQSIEEYSKCGGVHLLLGYLGYVHGDVATTLDEYRKAREAYDRASESVRVIQAEIYLGHALVMADELDEAETVASTASEAARKNGEYSLLSESLAVMAEIERFRGNYEEAAKLNAETAYWRRLNGRQAEIVTRFNDALVRLGQRDWDRAASEFEDLLEVIDSRPDKHLEPLIHLGLAIAFLGLDAHEKFEKHLAFALENQGDKPDRDFAWTLQIGAKFADEANLDAAARLSDLATEYLDMLGLQN